jgi:asparagine synthase (glutamine-hydrolysing)
VSGLCGWIGHGISTAENLQLVRRMAEPLSRFDGSGVRSVSGRQSAASIAASASSAHLYHTDGLTIAIWGQPGLMDKDRGLLATPEGIAKTLADQWRNKRAEVLTNLSGTFSLCILDDDAAEAVLATDRMGIYPVSYQLSRQTLVFGSTADSIIMHPSLEPEIAPQSLYNYVYFHMVPGPGTIYEGQNRLLPGEYLMYRKGQVETRKYWDMQFHESERRPFQELRENFIDVLRSSVRAAVGGEKVGAFLSGGTDSSTIAGILGEVTGQPAQTYSIGFDASGYDEMAYARIAARHFGTRHQEYYVTPDDIVTAIPQVAAVFDQPFGNSSAIPSFYCARMAKADGLSRMLGGDGGDELFGGNSRYAKQHLFSLYERVPPVVRKALIEPMVFNFPSSLAPPLMRKARSYVEQALIGMPGRTETYNLLEYYGAREVFTREFLETIDPAYPAGLLSEIYHQNTAKSLINRMLAFDRKFTLADNDLPKVSKACELAGMEAAYPLISNEVVDFSLRLEPQLKLKGTKLRYFFKEALRGFLPDEIIVKQKHGFGLPFGVWLQDHKPLQTLASDSLSDLKTRNIINPRFIDKLLGQHVGEHAGYHGTMVWVLMMLEQWYRQRQGAPRA